jgi:hypothetical protein
MNMFGIEQDAVFDALIPVLLMPPNPDSGDKQAIMNRFKYQDKKAGIDQIPEKREKLRLVRSVLACCFPVCRFLGAFAA